MFLHKNIKIQIQVHPSIASILSIGNKMQNTGERGWGEVGTITCNAKWASIWIEMKMQVYEREKLGVQSCRTKLDFCHRGPQNVNTHKPEKRLHTTRRPDFNCFLPSLMCGGPSNINLPRETQGWRGRGLRRIWCFFLNSRNETSSGLWFGG